MSLEWAMANMWLLLGAAAVVLYVIGLMKVNTRPAGAPPVVKSMIPYLGSFMDFAASPLGSVERAQKKLGNIFTMTIFGNKMTFLLGPTAHAAFFQARDNQCSQQEVYNFMTPVFGKGVVYDAPLHIFHQQLRFLSAGLKTEPLKTYVPFIAQEVKTYFSKWGQSGEFEVLDEMSKLIICTASGCLMGPEVHDKLFEHGGVADLYHKLDEGITPLAYFWPTAPIPKHLARNKARDAMVKLFGEVIRYRRSTGSNGTDILQKLMDCEYRSGEKLTDDEITGCMIALLFAGQHTSTISATWTLIYMLNNRRIYDKAVQEQRDIMARYGEELSFEAMGEMNYLKNCMKEALRLAPPLIFVMRYAKVPLTIGDYVIPAGHRLVVSTAISMKMEEAFPDEPEEYKPERFERLDAEMRGEPVEGPKHKEFSWIGFGGGLHACMGEQFAYLQVRSILSTILRNFELEIVTPGIPEKDYKAMVVGPKGRNMIRFTRRQLKA